MSRGSVQRGSAAAKRSCPADDLEDRALETQELLLPLESSAVAHELAERSGNPRAARAVGMVMNRNRIPIVLPCHRIVGSTGELVGYGGGLERKEKLLRLEGAML